MYKASPNADCTLLIYMDNKLLLPDLAELLAAKAGITKKSADNFVRTFFTTIEQNLLNERYVKVKNFGTFKIISVSERESVNVATGERFQIGSHSKISFTAEGMLRDLVNEPFAHLSSIEVADDVDMDALDAVPTIEEPTVAEVPAEVIDETPEEEAMEEIVVTEEKTIVAEEKPIVTEEEEPQAPEEETKVADTEAPQPEEEVSEYREEEAGVEEEEPEIEEEEIEMEEEEEPEPAYVPSEEGSVNWWKVGFLTLLVFLLMLGSYFAGYYRIFSETATSPETPAPAPVVNTLTTDTTSVVPTEEETAEALALEEAKKAEAEAKKSQEEAEKKAKEEAEKKAKEEAEKKAKEEAEKKAREAEKKANLENKRNAAKDYRQMPGGKYDIVGVMAHHTFHQGETLIGVARKYYGDPHCVNYIVFYNNITNPDIVPVGTRLKIPELLKR